MLVVFQHPVIDIRCLVENNYKLSIPNWPIPEEETMMKFIGSTVRRFRGGSTYWSGEHKFCNARNAIQFSGLEKYKIIFPNNFQLLTEGAFRRLNSNGNFLVKYEIGLANKLESFLDKLPSNNNSIEFLLSEYCNIKVQIKNPVGENMETEIYHCGKPLSELYLYSTSSKEGLIDNKIENWWTIPGDPVCIVEFDDFNNELKLPKYSTLVKNYSNSDYELYHCWSDLSGNKKIRTWIIKKLKAYPNNDSIRDLRLNLLRINAEKETLRKLLFLLQKKGTQLLNKEENKTIVNNYLDIISSKLLKEIRYGINQNDILENALKAEETARPGELESYRETLNTFKNKYLTSKVEQLINKGTIINVTGGEIHEINITEKGNIIKNGN